MPWDEQKVGIRNGWAIGQAVQMLCSYKGEVTRDIEQEIIKEWTQWFLKYAEELRDEQADAYNASHTQYKPVSSDIKPRYIPEGVSQGKMQGTVYTPPKAKQ